MGANKTMFKLEQLGRMIAENHTQASKQEKKEIYSKKLLNMSAKELRFRLHKSNALLEEKERSNRQMIKTLDEYRQEIQRLERLLDGHRNKKIDV